MSKVDEPFGMIKMVDPESWEPQKRVLIQNWNEAYPRLQQICRRRGREVMVSDFLHFWESCKVSMS